MGTFSHLFGAGLIEFNGVLAFQIDQRGPLVQVEYFNEVTSLFFPPSGVNRVLPVGYVNLTGVGLELASLCKVSPMEGFLEYALAHWRERYGIVNGVPWTPVAKQPD